VSEGVVVPLEAVEVEEHDRVRVVGVRIGDDDVQVAHELAPVAEVAEAVGHRVMGAVAQHPDVLHERQDCAHDTRGQRTGRQQDRGGGDVREAGGDEDRQGQRDEDQRKGDDVKRRHRPD
jgi:hypothetical protein